MRLSPFALALILAAGAARGRDAGGGTPYCTRDYLCLSRDLHGHERAWVSEAETRLPGVFVLVVHGWCHRGEWYCTPYPDLDYPRVKARHLARALKFLLGARPILMVCCNEGGLPLGVRGVWYGRRGVWDRPGNDAGVNARTGAAANCIGNVWEFAADDGTDEAVPSVAGHAAHTAARFEGTLGDD